MLWETHNFLLLQQVNGSHHPQYSSQFNYSVLSTILWTSPQRTAYIRGHMHNDILMCMSTRTKSREGRAQKKLGWQTTLRCILFLRNQDLTHYLYSLPPLNAMHSWYYLRSNLLCTATQRQISLTSLAQHQQVYQHVHSRYRQLILHKPYFVRETPECRQSTLAVSVDPPM